jgi:ubiquinone biosynthesis protein
MLDHQLVPTPLTQKEEKPKILILQPTDARWRLLSILVTILHWLADILFLCVTGRWTEERNARRTRQMLEHLGFLWIKVGQILSLRTDFFSVIFCSELSNLQYAAHGFPGSIARNIIETELKGTIEEFFDGYDEVPFAAASIAQVHSARLRRNGVQVVIKVMRPGAQEVFAADLRFVRWAVAWIEWLNVFSFMRWSEALWELEQIMAEELDYRFEVSNLERMHKELRKHHVYVPEPFPRLCTRRVIVMERIEGALMSDFINMKERDPQRVFMWLVENNIDPALVGERLYMSFMRQLFEEDLFHGDLHPGNIFLLRDSQLALIDLGTAGTVESTLLRKYIFITKAIATRQLEKAADLMLSMSPQLPAIDLTQVREEMVRSLRQWELRTPVKKLSYYEKSLTYGTTDLVRILAKYRISITWGFLKIDRTWATMDASMNYLMPEVDYPVLIRKYFYRRAKRIIRRTLRLKKIGATIAETEDLASEYSLFIDPQIRMAGLAFGGAGTLASQLVAILLQMLSTLALACVAYCLAAFFHQHRGFLTGTHYRVLRDYLDRAPRMETELWVPVILFFIYVYWKLRQLTTASSSRELKLPGNVNVRAPRRRRRLPYPGNT